MEFKDRLVSFRKIRELTQTELANKVGITLRAVQYYEQGTRTPSTETVEKIADALEVSRDALMTDEEFFVVEAQERYGAKGRKSAQNLIDNAQALFAGGDVTDEDKDEVFRAITEAYWEAKEINKRKYTPKKYRKE